MTSISKINLKLMVGWAFAFVSGVQASDITNPGFEDGWVGWSKQSPSGEGIALSSEAASGAKSAKVTEAKAYLSQVVAVQPNSSYELTVQVRGVGTIGVKVGAEIFFEQTPKKTKEWAPVQVRFESGNNASITVFGSHAGLEGRFDDFMLTALDQPLAQKSKKILSSASGGYGLSPDLPPGKNFDLLGWYLNTPADDDNDGKSDRFSETELARGFEDPNYFFTAADGGMVFRSTVSGAKTSKNTRFTRSELREMLRRGDTSIGTRNENRTPNKNNWVFSSAPEKARLAAGAVDGTLRATLAVNRVTQTGDSSRVGELVIGQIHAASDEPARLYYRKLPGHEKGSIYLAHEISGGDDIYTNLLGDRSDSAADPEKGIALDEKFSYVIKATGNTLYVAISQQDELLAETTVDMSDSGYDVANDYMYFKAGAYNQNNTGDDDDYDQVTFYELEASHP